uniref:Uncharacterized protein n=1 Tax=Grammatophora oceanica TaxID=210454 RepID=A0A7S1VX68_9STRA|mmetsp:Transcript_89/g.99  ORF Transcript_89/g.99 Transcript_89/m.99 type:complete len:168 (+) Transcript_89:312-815(+)
MFAKSAASDTLQGKAIQAVNSKWGEDFRGWNGRETIGIPVCKKKYTPFTFKVEKRSDGTQYVSVERMFGCRCHSGVRKSVIEQHGCREGWEPFGQWSLRKATEMARKEGDRINGEGATSDEAVSSDDERNTLSMCNNGNCTWKVRRKYDNVHKELTGEESDDDFDYS